MLPVQPPDKNRADSGVIFARSLLNQHPVDAAQVLSSIDDETAGFVYATWADRADALSRAAGNTLITELVVRAAVSTVIGVGIGYAIGGLQVAWAGLILPLLVIVWWRSNRRTWHRSVARAIIWGALIFDDIKMRYENSGPEGEIIINKVGNNVGRFASNYEKWTGRPLARRIG